MDSNNLLRCKGFHSHFRIKVWSHLTWKIKGTALAIYIIWYSSRNAIEKIAVYGQIYFANFSADERFCLIKLKFNSIQVCWSKYRLAAPHKIYWCSQTHAEEIAEDLILKFQQLDALWEVNPLPMDDASFLEELEALRPFFGQSVWLHFYWQLWQWKRDFIRKECTKIGKIMDLIHRWKTHSAASETNLKRNWA